MWRGNFPRDAAARIRHMYKFQRAEDRPTSYLESKSGFDNKELDNLKDIFRYFDKDQNKYLDKKELNSLLGHQIGERPHKQYFDLVFKKIDINSDGMVSFPEFLLHQANRKKKLPTNAVINSHFELFDRNEDGLLNLDEVRHLLLYMGRDAGRMDLRQIFVSVDSDKDGLITRKEFNTMVRDHFGN